jgi:hypothetical protein
MNVFYALLRKQKKKYYTSNKSNLSLGQGGICCDSFHRIKCVLTWNDIHVKNFTQVPQEFNIVKYYHQLQTYFFAGRFILRSFRLQILQASANNGP